MSFLKKLSALIGISLVAGLGTAFAISIPISPALFDTSLAIPQATGDTQLTMVTAPNINAGDFVCVAVDSGLTTLEYECGTASSTPTVITSLSRGLDFRSGTTTITANIFSHRSGADVRITTFPVLSYFQQILAGTNSFTNVLSYSSTSTIATTSLQIPYASWVNNLVNLYIANATSSFLGLNNTWTGTNTFSANTIENGTPVFNNGATFQTVAPNDSVTPTSPNNIANKAYVDGVAIAGSPISSNTLTGIGRTASSTQIAGGLSGGTTTPYFIPSTLASSTATGGSIVVVASSSTGWIDASFISTSSLANVVLSSGASQVNTYTTSVSTSTATSTWSKPAGAKMICVVVIGGGGGGDAFSSPVAGGGGGGGALSSGCFTSDIATSTILVTIGKGGPGGTSGSGGTTGATSSFSTYISSGGGIGAPGGTSGTGGVASTTLSGSFSLQNGASGGTCGVTSQGCGGGGAGGGGTGGTGSSPNGGTASPYNSLAGAGGSGGNSAIGVNGSNYGGGGGGSGSTGLKAGDGAPGYIQVTTYF